MAKKAKQNSKQHAEPGDVDMNSVQQQPEVAETRLKSRQEVEQLFDATYLQQASKEFADDLDRLRTANDFKGDRSVQVLGRERLTLIHSSHQQHRD
ncbi:hypothetical protein AMS68_005746 [Peltaster fructicola]|uniref:Ribosome-assembly protein 3 C-terminal domain-containing protein n=1 Tax=Peltaster fructicola TaxID=286661 RepID=A0A6H0Y035_9PEZI|nr:hypothetical protein AMS68_005746 [Peltaster fructicola]